MKPLATAVLLLLAASPLLAQAPGPPIQAHTLRGFTLDGELQEWSDLGVSPIELGDANRIVGEEGGLSTTWAGVDDLSGAFFVGFTANDLVIAGTVRDDVLTLNPRVRWLGDDIEIFIDIDLDQEEADPALYNQDDYQLILSPLSPNDTWGFAVAAGWKGMSDGRFDGVRTAAKMLANEQGGYLGYTFEAAIPLVNFPGLTVKKGGEIGFDIALVDADGEFVQKTYMTASGRAGLASDPSRFGRLRFPAVPPATPRPAAADRIGILEPAAILIGAALVLVLLWWFRHGLLALAEIRIRWKLAAIGLMLGLVVVAHLLPLLFGSARRGQQRDALTRSVAVLEGVLVEAGSEGILGSRDAPPDASRVMSLLTGKGAVPPERFEFRPLWIREPKRSRTSADTPIVVYRRRLAAGERARFVPPDPVPARAVSLVYHLEPDPSSRRSLEPGVLVATARILLELKEGEEIEVPIRFGEEVDVYDAPIGELHGARAAGVAWRNSAEDTHADELTIDLPEGASVVHVELTQPFEEGTLVVHGVTLLGEEPTPLPLVSPSLGGVPMSTWESRPTGSAEVMRAGSEPVRIDLVSPADRVWFFLSGPVTRDAQVSGTPGLPLISLTPLGTEGETGEPFLLLNAVHVVPENASEYPQEFEARPACRWTPPGSWSRHRDVVELRAPFPMAAIEAAVVGESGAVILAGATQGQSVPHRVGEKLDLLTYDADEGRYGLTDDARAALDGLSLTWYDAGRAERTTLPEAEVVIGSSLPTGAMGRADADGLQLRSLGRREYLARFLPITAGSSDVLEASLPLPGTEDVEAVSQVAFYLLLALLLLGVLLVVADLLSRFSRIRTKLTVGFAVAALVPLLLLFLGLSGILEREVSRSESSTLLEQIELVKARIHRMRDIVRRDARTALSDPALLSALPDEESRTYVRDPEEALAGISLPFAPGLEVFAEDAFPIAGDPSPRVFPRDAKDHPFLGIREPADDLAYRSSEIMMGGVASMGVQDGRRTIALQAPVGADLLLDLKTRFGRRFELILFTLRGYPYAGTLDLTGEYARPRMLSRQRAVEEVDLNRKAVLRQETLAGAPCTVAYDVIRTRRGEPVALLAAALPRQEFIAARTEIRNLFLLLGAVILVLEVIVGNIMTRRITEPLTSLSRGARAVAEGKLQTRVGIRGNDEIGDLSESFDRMTEELGRRLGELSKLNAAIRSFSGSLQQGLVLDRAVTAFRWAVSPPDVLVIAVGDDEGVEITAGFRDERALKPRRMRGDGLLGRMLELRTPTEVVEVGPLTEEEQKTIGVVSSIVVVPFEPGREARGAVLLIYSSAPPDLSRSDLEFLSTMAQQVAIALENARLNQLAIEDPATGLYVHSYFLARLREETDRAQAAGRSLSVILVALDEATRVYGNLGAEEGDGLMQEAARRLRSAAKGMSIMARADESTIEIMLAEATKEQALAIAQSFRSALTRSPRRLIGEPSRTVAYSPSIGLASCPEDARSAEFLMAEAHRALYKAVIDRAGTKLVDGGRERERLERRAEGRAGRFVFRSEEMLEILETVDRIAESDVPILVQGETGVGKEVIAELVHEKSRRRGKPLVKLNCAALPEALLESELFGYEKGAFTGADRRKPGRFELAEGGTIFLDEIGEIPPQTQVKLLRVLQDHRVERLGSTSLMRVDVRVIAATNRDLLASIREGGFREDLYFRLNVVSIVVPPLRTRKEEIPDLVDRFVESYLKVNKATGRKLSPAAMDRLFAHSWPGNVRELRNTIERALVIAHGEEIRPDEIAFSEPAQREADRPLPTAPMRTGAPETAAPSSLNPRQEKLLEILSRRESITNREYADLVGISPRTGNRDLNELIAMGRIVKLGRRRGAVYRLPG